VLKPLCLVESESKSAILRGKLFHVDFGILSMLNSWGVRRAIYLVAKQASYHTWRALHGRIYSVA
jgi:hypothetical protein